MAQDRRGENGEDKVLEGEIIAPGTRREEYRETIRIVKLGWFGRIALAAVVLSALALALFLSFWILVLTIPLLLVAAIWSWLRRSTG